MSNPNLFKKRHAINSWLNLILSVALVVCVFGSVVVNLLSNPTDIVQEVGIKTFRMFTVLSNMFVGITAAMSVPFAVDGIRYENYHLPRWIINLTYVSVTCITLTFTITLFVLSPLAGFKQMMLLGKNLFLHTIVPVVAILSFLFINIYHNVKFRTTFLALVPILLYAVVYIISAIVIGEENGGWRDHYHFQELMPWYIMFVVIMVVSFGIAIFLRVVHNRMHQQDKKNAELYYQTSLEYDLPTIEDVIIKLALEDRIKDKGGEVIVPRRIINILEKKYESGKSLSDLCYIYIEEYLK